MKTIISRLTPSGRSAVGSFSLEGPDAFDLFKTLFRRPSGKSIELEDLSKPSIKDRPVFGWLFLSEQVHEDVLVHFIDQDHIEFHSHGGDSIAQAIMDLLVSKGAEADSSPFVSCPLRTENDHSEKYSTKIKQSLTEDSISEEVTRLLPFCRTEKTAYLLLNQTADLFEQTRRDNPKKLLNRISLGRHLTEPFNILIVGPPNAGKSSLLNAILGFDRVIVDQTAGTTRDAVGVETVLDGWPVLFFDTAGIRDHAEQIERKGIEQIGKRLEEADLLLFIYEAVDSVRDPIQSCVRTLSELLQKDLRPLVERKKILLIMNKIDLLETRDMLTGRNSSVSNKGNIEHSYEASPLRKFDLGISTKTGENLEKLEKEIVRTLLGPDDYDQLERELEKGLPIAIPFTDAQRLAIQN